MKKAMAAFAIIFAVALIGTIGFGVAVGTDTLRTIWSDEFDWDLPHSIASLHGMVTSLEDWEAETVDGYPVIFEETKEFNAASARKTEILVDAGAVRIHPTNDGVTKATLRIYGSREKGFNPYTFSVTQQGDETDIALHVKQGNRNWPGLTAVRLEIWLPAEQLDELDLTLNAGNLLLEQPNVRDLDLTLNAGNLTVREARLGQADIKVNAGNCVFVAGAPVSDSLEATVNAGNLELYLPQEQAFHLLYKVMAGGFSYDFPDVQVIRSSGAVAQREGELTHGENGRRCEIEFKINAGNASVMESAAAPLSDADSVSHT